MLSALQPVNDIKIIKQIKKLIIRFILYSSLLFYKMQFGYKVLRALCILYFVNICPNRGAASYLLFCYYIINSYTCQMMHRLRRYDVFRFAQNDVAPLRSAMMRCLPQCAVRHASFAKRTSSGVAVIICRRQTSFKKRTFVLVDKCSFFVAKEQ